MIKAIIFDLFGVLYVHRGAEFTKTVIPADKLYIVEDLDKQTNLGLINQAEYEQAIANMTRLPISQVHRGLIAGFGRNELLISYILELKETHKIAMLSNIGKHDIDNYFQQSELSKIFDVVVLSSDIGAMKPDPKSYLYTCRQLGEDPAETIMIDDIYENCEGARSAGLKAIQYDGFAHLKRTLHGSLND